MKKTKIAILDDNLMQLEEITNLCKLYYEKKKKNCNIKKYTHPSLFLKENFLDFDLLLLDIEMPIVNGIEIAKQVRKQNKHCFICFITNFNDYVFQSYDVHAFDFVMKPVNEEKIIKLLDDVNSYMNAYSKSEEKISLCTTEGEINIPSSQIIYLEYLDKFNTFNRVIKVHTQSKDYFVKEKISEIYERLPKKQYVMPHKSYIINMENIKLFKKTEILMSDNTIIPLSQKRSASIRISFNEFMKGIH